MEGWSRDKIIEIIASDMDRINSKKEEIKKMIEDLAQENLEFLDALLEQIPKSLSGPLLSKTPKVLRKRNVKRIQTIPEDDTMEITTDTEDTRTREKSTEIKEEVVESGAGRRSKREASKKAGEIMKQQQSINLHTKLRRPSKDENDISCLSKTSSRESRSKRVRSLRSSDSDQDDVKRPVKQSKNETKAQKAKSTRAKQKQESVEESVQNSDDEDIITPKVKKLSSVKRKHEGRSSRKSNRSASLHSPDLKKANIIDETYETQSDDDTIEPSMYEDAIGKAVPIMNSTMKPTSFSNQTHIITPAASETRTLNSAANETRTLNPCANETHIITSNLKQSMDRMMNVTVVLEAVKPMNETVTVTRASNRNLNSGSISNSNPAINKIAGTPNEQNDPLFTAPLSKSKIPPNKANPIAELNFLITDDDSSPERKHPREKKLHKKCSVVKTKAFEAEEAPSRQKRITRSSLLSEDEVDLTPDRKVLRDMNSERNKKDAKNGFKQNALFSPYAKESVKKRVEAFEQAGLVAPVVETDTGMRLTRTKTRALAAASENGEQNPSNTQSVAQKLARKSLAKAKQISRAKEAKETEESKENHLNSVQKLVPNDKLMQKQQQRTTPNSKIRPPMPSSLTRNQTTPSNSQSLSSYSKVMTGSRTNIVTNVDSFIQPKGSAQKSSSVDKMLEEKKRRQLEEDAKKKRDEALRAQIEEKRRKREEKEKKNRLAREAKEKVEVEKRLKAEREKEEKAKLALLAQEKKREEVEKKRMEQLHRAQEKEERRKQDEQQRLLRLQEQEETERQLAEQKRREQEAERRRLAEAKAQQQAVAEAMKLKNQILAAQVKKQQAIAQNKQQQPSSYKIDSEPDSDSDDEIRPKHEIPVWAKPHYRQKHLAMQENVSLQAIRLFFDVKKCTPDLADLFQGIDKNRLKRTSSAIWKTPPRFSMMEALN